ncbi:hypothetical protein NEMBOFW57_002692 [Staphylotrichum longicolle]|uniref:Uncharacterized protein n=1 Tax=Staphylotrichum longicolle TaxID=669026 RepID=A0AAD4F4R4_9PEZI|nr:hypothetical protein NEMBOFW57_002692 [Staphylotrichum longicolle]
MNRHALRSALGRAGSHRALLTPISTPTPASFFNFSTTTSRPAENNSSSSNNNTTKSNGSQTAAVEKLTQLNKRRNSRSEGAPASSSNSNNTSPNKGGLDEIPGLPSNNNSNNNSSSSSTRSGGGIDARSLRVSPSDGGGAAAGPGGPRVLNVRSLRGGFRGRTAFGLAGGRAAAPGGDAGPGAQLRRPRFGFGASAGAGAGAGGAGAGAGRRGGFQSRFGAGAGGATARGAGRFGGVGGGAGRRGRGGARGRGGRAAGGREKRKEKETSPGQGKVRWSDAEREVIDRLEQGEVVRFDPKVTLDSLSGYGAALATDAPIGQVETALRTMRLMTGGMAFNADSGVTADVKAIMERYKAKKPIFVHSKEEKAWIESAQPKLRIAGPDAAAKKAIVDVAIRGKYETTQFAELSNVQAVMANYHTRSFTYMSADSQKFMDKVLSLLPAQGGGKPAAQARK